MSSNAHSARPVARLRRSLGVVLAASLVLVAVTPLPAGAYARPATISGTVTDGGQPVAGACVKLTDRLGAGVHGWSCTGADGRYRIAGQYGGNIVRISVKAPGYPEYFYPQRPNLASAEQISVEMHTTQVRDIALTHDSGTVGGRITWSDGTPASKFTVRAVPVSDPAFTLYVTQTRIDGSYELSWLPPGDYRIRLGSGSHWVPGGTSADQASKFTIGSGTVTIDDVMLPTFTPPAIGPAGSISGTVTDRITGAPLAGACLSAVDSTYKYAGLVRARTCTGADGRYSISGLPVILGGYWVAADAAEHVKLWAGDSPTLDGATSINVQAGTEEVADFALRRQAGVLAGQILTPAGESEGSRWTVTASAVGYSWTASTVTNVGGYYLFEGMPPGAYRLSYAALGRSTQWWPGTVDEAAAGTVTVTADAVTAADATVLPATLTIRLVEQGSGAPATRACARIAGQQLCGSADGVYRLTLPLGGYGISVPRSVYYFDHADETVALSNGSVVEHTIELRRAGTISTTVDSSVRPFDSSRVCVSLVPVRFAADPIGQAPLYCNYTAAAGAQHNFVIGPLALDEPVQLFVRAVDSEQGSQWLGSAGGTGQRATAAIVTPATGSDVTAPPIVLDAAAGVDVYTYDTSGNQLPACAAPYGAVGGLVTLGTAQALLNCSGGPGIGISRLGPYRWDLQVSSPGYATTWYAAGTNRAGSTPLQAGDNVTAAVQLRPGATLSGAVQVADGWQLNDVTVFDAITGDVISQAYRAGGDDRTFSFTTLNSGRVFLRARATSGATCWHWPAGGVRGDFGTGPAISVAPGQQLTAQVGLGPDCQSGTPILLTKPLPPRGATR